MLDLYLVILLDAATRFLDSSSCCSCPAVLLIVLHTADCIHPPCPALLTHNGTLFLQPSHPSPSRVFCELSSAIGSSSLAEPGTLLSVSPSFLMLIKQHLLPIATNQQGSQDLRMNPFTVRCGEQGSQNSMQESDSQSLL